MRDLVDTDKAIRSLITKDGEKLDATAEASGQNVCYLRTYQISDACILYYNVLLQNLTSTHWARDSFTTPPKPTPKPKPTYLKPKRGFSESASPNYNDMRTSTLAIDGLWRCLCPSVSLVDTARLVRARRTIPKPSVRCLHVSRTAQASAAATLAPRTQRDTTPRVWRPRIGFANSNPDQLQRNDRLRIRPDTQSGDQFEGRDLSQKETSILYEWLRSAARRGATDRVERIVQELVKERGEQPNGRLYGALILVNTNPKDGAAWRVAALLQQMEEEGVDIDVGICHDVLKVLSVHVDYVLRADILHYMYTRWFALSRDGHHDVAAALFREGQFELALDQLRKMGDDGIRTEIWLLDLATYMLIDSGEIDQVLALMRGRMSSGEMEISKTLWQHLLDAASQAFHHAATSYVWDTQVVPGYINPSSGLCMDVLTTAGRAGDAALATEAFRVLGMRSTVFRAAHYEQLLATYMATSPADLRSALTILSIMKGSKIEPTPESTRPIFQYLRTRSDETTNAFGILTSIFQAGRDIPIASLNVLIEAHIAQGNLEGALTVYKAMHTFERISEPGATGTSPHKPLANTETFNLLLRAWKNDSSENYETVAFLVSEMRALGVPWDFDTYDRLFILAVGGNQIDDAFKYFEEMRQLDWFPRTATLKIVATALARQGNKRCWDLVQALHDRGKFEAAEDMAKDIEREWEDKTH